ncbi:hypothetical protein LLG10_01815, partial [bacterium]|nr:hypothetical protein [bacterium]
DSEAYDYISTDSTFNGNDELTGYTQTVQRDSQNAFTETNGMTYNSNHQVGTISYSSNNRTITYGYSAGLGQVNSIAYSDIAGNFSVSYSALTNNLSSIAYPTGLGSGYETYTYEPAGRGRLTQITYPNTDTLVFSWNNKDQITQITFDDGTTETSYAITYNGMGKVASYTKSEDSYEIEEWTFAYGPHGLEYARKFVNDEEILTQDFTTDQTGIILSMTYTEDDAEEGVNGEYYFHYDNFGNTVLLTDENGVPKYTALYDISNGKRVQEWNPNDLQFSFKGGGQAENVTLPFDGIDVDLHGIELVVRKYVPISISDLVTGITITGRWWTWRIWGITFDPCGGKCPPDRPYYICFCYYTEDIFHNSYGTISIGKGCEQSLQLGIFNYSIKSQICDCYAAIMS